MAPAPAHWVVFKLGINVFASIVLLMHRETVGVLAGVAAQSSADLGRLRGPTFVLHSGTALLLLLAATVLAVYKPRPLTRFAGMRPGPLLMVSRIPST
jgi:hypothetical protein